LRELSGSAHFKKLRSGEEKKDKEVDFSNRVFSKFAQAVKDQLSEIWQTFTSSSLRKSS
jgi:peptidyl-tRNA hydrolase